MSEQKSTPRLSDISTLWSMVRAAHHGSPEVRALAQKNLLDRYGHAIASYLRKAIQDADAAEELYQEFVCQFLSGNFWRANPASGRFRDYVKTSLIHLISHYRKKQQARLLPLPAELPEPVKSDPASFSSDEVFLECWRKELLACAWKALHQVQVRTGQAVYTVLRFRVDHSGLPAAAMAEQLSVLLGRPLTADAARQALHRAREQFATLLLKAVQQSLEQPTRDLVEQELLDLNLYEYCRPALERTSRT